MGVGTGAYWDAIERFGGPQRTPGEAVAALREEIEIMRLLWQDQTGASRAVSYLWVTLSAHELAALHPQT